MYRKLLEELNKAKEIRVRYVDTSVSVLECFVVSEILKLSLP